MFFPLWSYYKVTYIVFRNFFLYFIFLYFIFFLYYIYIFFKHIEYDFEVLFKEAENRMLTLWPQFSAKVRRELINIGVREENIGKKVIFS